MINISNVIASMTTQPLKILTTLSGLSILQHDDRTYVLPVVTGMYLIKHTNKFFTLKADFLNPKLHNTQYWYVIGYDTGGKKAIEYNIPHDQNYRISKSIHHRRWLRGLPTDIPCTVIENMNEVFVKYFALESRLSDIPTRYQERVGSEFKPRLKEIVAYHG